MNRRLTPRGRERRAQLMAQAAHLFADNGYHPTSVSQIVEALGVGKGVFYWYFDSKEELFVELLRDAQLALRRRQQTEIGAEPDPVNRLALGMRASMVWFSENRHMFNLFQFARTEERFAPTMRTNEEIGLADAMRLVSEGIAAGAIRDADPLVLTYVVMGITNQLAQTFVYERGDPPERVAEVAVAAMLHGLVGGMESERHTLIGPRAHPSREARAIALAPRPRQGNR